MTQNQIRYLELQESKRSNQAKEAENYRSNLAKEQENYRSNLAKETETNRSNLENERRQAEALEYEKYGKSGVGGTVRTIKAGLDDLYRVGERLAGSSSAPQQAKESIGLNDNLKGFDTSIVGNNNGSKSSYTFTTLDQLNKDISDLQQRISRLRRPNAALTTRYKELIELKKIKEKEGK